MSNAGSLFNQVGNSDSFNFNNFSEEKVFSPQNPNRISI